MRITFGGPIARQPVTALLSSRNDVQFQAFDTVAEAADNAMSSDVLVIADPRGEPGKQLAQRLREPGCPVKWIQIVTAGTAGLTAHELPETLLVTNQGGAVAPVVAEHAMGLMIALNRRFDAFFAASARGEWQQKVEPAHRSLEGLTLCIVGFGNIGQELAKKARAFNMRIVGVNRSGGAHALADTMFPLSRLADALAEADVAVLCLALTEETRNLIEARMLAALKPQAVLINVARGEILDQSAFAAAMRSGHIRAAGLDVTTPEPLPSGHELWSLPNVVITPHIAGGGSPMTGKRIASVLEQNLERFRAGQPLLHQVYGPRP